MISASKLIRYCGYVHVLAALPPKGKAELQREENKRLAADRGRVFHQAVDDWVARGNLPMVDDLEIQGWLDLLMSQWAPPVSTVTEVAWGLSPSGEYLEVDEPEPHVYVARNGSSLLTAGRLDVGWTQGANIYGDRPHIAACCDWKTGRYPVTPAHRNLQCNAGGMALAQKLGAEAYLPGVYYTRDGFFDWGEPVLLGSPEHQAMFAEVKMAALLDGTPVPGSHCSSCWERKRCAHATP